MSLYSQQILNSRGVGEGRKIIFLEFIPDLLKFLGQTKETYVYFWRLLCRVLHKEKCVFFLGAGGIEWCQRAGPGSLRHICVCVLTLTGYMSSGKLLSLFNSQFPNLQQGCDFLYCTWVGLNETLCKKLAQCVKPVVSVQ